MPNRRRTVIMVGSVALTAILSARLDLPRRSNAALPAPARELTIVRLAGNNQDITITTGPAGLLYSVTRDGILLVDRATLAELQTKDPAAYKQVQSATATADSAPNIWAGIE